MCSCSAFGIAAKTSSRLLVVSLVDRALPQARPNELIQCPVASAANRSGACGASLPRQTTCMSGRSSSRSCRRRHGRAHRELRAPATGRRWRRRPVAAGRHRRACRRAAAACNRGRSRCGPASRCRRRNHTCGSRAPGKVVGTYSMKLCSGAVPRLRRDQRRADIAVAELGADHFARLVLLDVGHARELRACCHAGGRVARGFRADTVCASSCVRWLRSRMPRRCARRPAGARSRRTASRLGPPQPCSVAASFHDKSMASPTPVFMPSPPVGMTRWTASPARNTRPFAVAVGQQQILLPLPDIEHLVFDAAWRRSRSNIVAMSSSLSTTECRVKCRGRILDDQLLPSVIGDVIVTPLADRDALVEVLAIVQRLAKLQDVGLAVELDAELPAHRARAAVAADQVLRRDRGRCTVAGPDLRRRPNSRPARTR